SVRGAGVAFSVVVIHLGGRRCKGRGAKPGSDPNIASLTLRPPATVVAMLGSDPVFASRAICASRKGFVWSPPSSLTPPGGSAISRAQGSAPPTVGGHEAAPPTTRGSSHDRRTDRSNGTHHGRQDGAEGL